MKKLPRILLVAAGLPLALLAQPVEITLDEAVSTALRNDPAVRAAEYELDVGAARVRQARARYFPQIGVSGLSKRGLSGAMNHLEPQGLANSPLFRNTAIGVELTQPVLDFGRNANRLRSARLRRAAAVADLDAVKQETVLRVRSAYFGLLRARRAYAVAADMVRSRQVMVRQAQAFYEVKLRSRVDLEIARASLAEAELAALRASTEIVSANAQFGRAIGSSQQAEYYPLDPGASLPDLPGLEQMLDTARNTRPELRSLGARLSAAQAETELARSRRWPNFAFAYTGGYARFTEMVASNLMAGGVGLLMPIFTGGLLKGEVEEAEALAKAIQARLDDRRQQVELEVRSAWLDLRDALRVVPVLQVRAESARHAARLARERYAERLGAIVEVAQAESGLAAAEAALAIAAYDAQIAAARLRFAAGLP